MSPVLILSRLCLKRRFQFFGISDTSSLQHVEHLLDGFLVDHPAQARERGVLGRDPDGHVVVEDLDREVLAAFAEHLHLLLLQHLARAVMGIDDMVAELELDVLDLAGRPRAPRSALPLQLLVAEWCPPLLRPPVGRPVIQVCR